MLQFRRLTCRIDICRGYVALAVAGDRGTASKDLDTGCGQDREANMLAFAVQALKFVKEYIVGEAKI
jgi:hypothetical protein